MPTNDFLSPYGARKYSSGTAKSASVATQAALTALDAASPARVHGNIVDNDADGSSWYWHSTSTLTADDLFVDAADDAPSAGRWLRCPGAVDLRIAIAFGTADATVLATLPTGAVLRVHDLIWEVTTSWTGGSSSAIGVSSSVKSGLTTKGDLLGGATGDVLATLVSTAPGGLVPGTAGAKADTLAEVRALYFIAADTFRFDRITSAFTAGAGFVRIFGQLLRNAGA
jgi:hypothetical protein